jgi:hypothetical protein
MQIIMAEQIKQFLTSYLSDTHWKTSLLVHWPTIVGALKDRLTLEKIHDDALVLGVYDASWLQELYLLSPIILQTINTNLDQPRIKRLRFKQVYKKRSPHQTSHNFSDTKQMTVCLTKKEEEALCAIKDEQLRLALKNFLIRCYRERL